MAIYPRPRLCSTLSIGFAAASTPRSRSVELVTAIRGRGSVSRLPRLDLAPERLPLRRIFTDRGEGCVHLAEQDSVVVELGNSLVTELIGHRSSVRADDRADALGRAGDLGSALDLGSHTILTDRTQRFDDCFAHRHYE
jgi:hypothetical protein